MEFDAFDAGIELGGLRSRDDIKLLVCYLVKSVDGLTKTILNETMQESGLANYFEVNGALSELVRYGNITVEYTDDDEVLYITENGRDAAETLETNLPKTVREKAINSAIRLMTLARRQQENRIDVEKTEKGFNVTFTLADGDDESAAELVRGHRVSDDRLRRSDDHGLRGLVEPEEDRALEQARPRVRRRAGRRRVASSFIATSISSAVFQYFDKSFLLLKDTISSRAVSALT